MTYIDLGEVMTPQTSDLGKFTKKIKCRGCERPLIIKRNQRPSLVRCGVCKTIGEEKSKQEWLTLTRRSYNTNYGNTTCNQTL